MNLKKVSWLFVFLLILLAPISSVLAQEINIENNTLEEVNEETVQALQTNIINDSKKIMHDGNRAGALKKDGTLWMWGYNKKGQLGNGSTEESHIPVKVLDNVKQFSISNTLSVALKNDGTIWAWGCARYQLTDEISSEPHSSKYKFYSLVPVQMYDIENVNSVYSGSDTIYVLKNDGTIWAWGEMASHCVYSQTPVLLLDKVIQFDNNGQTDAAIRSDGTLWMRGNNQNGQIGNGTKDFSYEFTQTPGINNVVQVSVGSNHTGVIKNDGTVWTWGYNVFGALGNGTTQDSYIPIQVPNITDAKKIDLAQDTTGIIKNNGTLWTWGANLYNESNHAVLSPEKITSFNDITDVEVGFSTIAISRSDGTLWMWGENDDGILGNNSTDDAFAPIKILDGLNTGSEENPGITETYRIRVLDGDTGEPIPGVRISIGLTDERFTDSSGYAEFYFPNSEMVNLYKDGYNGRLLTTFDLKKDEVNIIRLGKTGSTDNPDPEEETEINPVVQKYIDQHKKYFNSGRYKSQITTYYPYSLSDAIYDINTDPDDISYSVLKGFNEIFGVNFTEQDLNKVIIARFIYDKNSPALESSYQSKVRKIQTKVTNKALSYLKKTGDIVLENKVAPKLRSLEEQMRSVDINSAQYQSLENEWNSVIDECAIPLDNAKQILSDAGTTVSIITSAYEATSNSMSEMMQLSIYGQAYLDASEEQIQALKMLGEVAGDTSTYDELDDPYFHADGDNYLTFSREFPEAVNSFISDMEKYKNSNSKDLIVYLHGLKAYGTSLAQSGINFGINLSLSKVTIKGVSISAALAIVQGVQAFGEVFTNIKQSHYNSSMVRRLYIANCALAKLTEKAGNELKASTGYGDEALDKAILFDQTIKMYKNALLFSFDNAVEYYQAINDNNIENMQIPGYKNWAYKKATENLEKQNRLNNDYDCLYECIQCHDKELDYEDVLINHSYGSNQNLNSYTICCPVTVTVKDNNGNLVATLSDTQVTIANPRYQNYFTLIDLPNGQKGKFALVPENYQVEIKGNGSGEMTVAVGKFNSNSDDLKSLQIFDDVKVDSSTNAKVTQNNNTGLKELVINGQTQKGENLDLNKVENEGPETPSTSTDSAHIQYQSHIENLGWVDYVKDGAPAGTEGQGLRQEAIRIQVVDNKGNPYSGLGVTYRSHVQDEGWQNYVSDNAVSGTTGKARKVEAVQIKLTGSKADQYDVWYQTHIEDYGWTNWAKNGEACGSEGFNKRMESIRIQILPKNSSAPSGSGLKLYSSYGPGLVRYRAHVENLGWQSYVSDGQNAGTTGQNLKLESLIIAPSPELPQGDIQASAHVQDIGWTDYVPSYNIIGTTGQNKRLEAIKLRLTGDLAKEYDIVYQSHVQDEGWQNEVRNDAVSGTTGLNRKIEAINIKLVKKGSSTTPSEPVTVPVTGIILNQKSLTLDPGEKFNLTYKITPDNATNKNLTWKSDNESIATVSSSGLVTAKGAGSTTVTATTQDGGYKASCSITVKAKIVNVESVTLNYSSYQLKPGETLSLIATIYPENATNKIISWSSSNPDIVSVDAIGNIRAIKNGTATVTVTTEDNSRTASCYVVVTDSTTSGDYYKFVFDKSEITIKVGETVTIPFTIDPEAEYSIVGYSFKKEIVSVAPSQKDVTITGEHVGDAEVSLEAHINGQDKQPRGTIKVHVIN